MSPFPARCFAALAVLLAVVVPVGSRAQSANDGFNPGQVANTYAVAALPDGRILIGGSFITVGGVARRNLARLNFDGTLDPTFVPPELDGAVHAIALQPDGRILIGGQFTHVGGSEYGRLARLTQAGTLDTGFSDPGLDNRVSAILVQPDGRILVAGAFQQAGLSARSNVARLLADGGVDSSFEADVSGGDVLALALQPDGKVWIGGAIVFVQGQVSRRFARLHPSGQLDLAFDPGAAGGATVVRTLALQPDGKLVVGGEFTSMLNVPRNHLARLNSDGSLDTGFNPQPSSPVVRALLAEDHRTVVLTSDGRLSRLGPAGAHDSTFTSCACSATPYDAARQSDGRIVVGASTNLLRFDDDGIPDTALIWGTNNFVFAAAPRTGDSVTIGGSFTEAGNTNQIPGSLVRNRLAELESGQVTSFNPNVGADVNAVLRQPDGTLLFGGSFAMAGNAVHQGLARANAAGAVDAAFDPSVSGAVDCIVRQPDGRILIGGSFTAVNGVPNTEYLARLLPDGSLDPTFDPGTGPNNRVLSLALEPDGSLLLAGEFNQVNGAPRSGIARLGPTGALDPTFQPTVTGLPTILLRLPDGRIVLGGLFTAVGGQSHRGLARLHPDGSIDGSFNATIEVENFSAPASLALQTDGRIVIGGSFSSVNGVAGIQGVARLLPDGSLDSSFDTDVNGQVQSVSLQREGKLLLGGLFSNVGGFSRFHVARLSATHPAVQSVSVLPHATGGTEVIWLRSGSGPEFTLPPTLQFSIAGVSFATVGTMQRIPGGWRYRADNFAVPLDQAFHLRLYGPVSAGKFNGSAGQIDVRRQYLFRSSAVLGEAIFEDGFETVGG